MNQIDVPGAFYLGREYDLASGKVRSTPLLYPSQDLTTHAVCVGMTGSGKTGLCVALLEEAALAGVPAIAIDPKGDLGNLLLAFPELRPSDFRPWIDESEAVRRGTTVDALAESTAKRWSDGLAEWGQSGERIRRFTEAVDRTVYTPGSTAGVPLAILKSFSAPSREVLQDQDALHDRIEGVTSGILGLLGIDADPVNSREHILLAKILDEAWRGGRDLDLAALIHEIQRPSFQQVGVMTLEAFFPSSQRHELAMQLNNLLASPTFASWLHGAPLDVERLLYTPQGKPRLSIVSIAHLSDSERMFFVTILLNEVISWMRTQPGAGSLRAILYMDEVFGYFPPTAAPPSKRPMLTLLKQARAYGVGCVLATQNPVDLDYKGLSNAGTWLLGRLQTERDKRRVLEGLEGASAEAGSNFDRATMEATLAALDSRVFLMNNVHADSPVVFQSRWAMSYLSGPLTRTQISALMSDRKAASEVASTAATETEAPANAAPAESHQQRRRTRPALPAEIKQRYWPVDQDGAAAAGERLEYRPALLGVGRLHYVKAADNVDVWRDFAAFQSVHGKLPQPPWDSAMVFEQRPMLVNEAPATADYAELPPELGEPKNYNRWDNDLATHLYQHERLTLWRCAELNATSAAGETEEAFRQRIAQTAATQLADQQEKVREKFAARIKRLEERVVKAEAKLAEEASQTKWRLLSMAGRVAEVLLGSVTGKRSRKKIVTSTSAGATMSQRRQQSRAAEQLEQARAELEKARGEEAKSLEEATASVRPERLQVEKLEIAPRKGDISVSEVALVWLPWRVEENGAARPAY